jgi:hypothetical protein
MQNDINLPDDIRIALLALIELLSTLDFSAATTDVKKAGEKAFVVLHDWLRRGE